MNWSRQLYQAMQECPKEMALWTLKSGRCDFVDLSQLIRRTQTYFISRKIGRGDCVLVLDQPGPRLYAAILALVGLGANALFVEPWMPPARINAIVQLVKPKAFWSPLVGQLWALRIASIRSIPHWIRPKQIDSSSDTREFISEAMDINDRAILSFSSGTTGQPKGIPRSHGNLIAVIEILRRFDEKVDITPDLVLFPNLVFYQLSRSRGSVLVPSKWTTEQLRGISSLPKDLRPNSLCCNPAFLKTITAIPEFPHLRWIAVGGALIDCDILEKFFERFPETQVEVIYGSTEVEPVSCVDARLSVKKSRERDLFQALYLGTPIPEIQFEGQSEGMWVTGPHVTTEYVTAADVDHKLKRRDDLGRIWHNMGDRIIVESDGFWYGGRSFQAEDDFKMEQIIYSTLNSSSCFLVRNQNQERVLVGENLINHQSELSAICSDLIGIVETKIIRDRRHRSRIDRQASLEPVRKQL